MFSQDLREVATWLGSFIDFNNVSEYFPSSYHESINSTQIWKRENTDRSSFIYNYIYKPMYTNLIYIKLTLLYTYITIILSNMIYNI